MRTWERAERLRCFIAAFEQKGDQSSEAQAWLEWANLQVQALDPLCSDLKAITDPTVVLSEYFTGRNSWEKPIKDWWDIDPKRKDSLFESIDGFEEDVEEDAGEVNDSSQSSGLITKPAWHPNQWYTWRHR